MKLIEFGKTQMWRVLAVVFAFLLTVVIAVMVIMTQNASFINGALGITNTKTVEVGSDEEVDTLYYKSAFTKFEDLYAHNKGIAKQLEAEGAVLLKNSGVLPLSKGAKVSCFSRSSVDYAYGGTGSGSVNATVAPTLKTAFENESKLSVNSTLWDAYVTYTASLSNAARCVSSFTGPATFYVREAPMSVYTPDVKASYAAYKDAAIVTITRVGGEGADPVVGDFGDGTKYLALQDDEKQMLTEVKDNFENIVVLINSSNAMEIDWLDEYGVDACLWVGGVGQEGLHAVADILIGNTNPSGRLVNIYAADSLSAPAMQNFGDFTFTNKAALDTALAGEYGANQSERYNKYLVYQEGIYVGYKYYETRYEDCILGKTGANGTKGVYASANGWNYAEEVTYPFGYGLSYSTFTQTLGAVTENENSFSVQVTVKNTGSRAGKDVVEIYAQTPYTAWDEANKIEKSAIQLVGFTKTPELAKDESKTVTVTVDKYDLATYDHKVNKGYILEAGDYYLSLGGDSHDALNNVLKAKGKSGMVDHAGKAAAGDASKTYKWTLSNTDTTKFMYSDVTKNKVTNQFDDVDLNYYGSNLVTYTTRKDWNTFPTPYSNFEANTKIIDALKFKYKQSTNTDTSMFKREQENGLNLAMMIGADYDDKHWDLLLDQLSIDDMMVIVGKAMKEAVISVGKPFNYLKDGPQAITGNVSSGGGLYYENPVGIAMLDNDKPTTTPTVAYTSEVVAASTWNVELVKEFGEALGEDGLWALVHHHYAPGANIQRTPYSGRNFEYYSEDGFLSSVMCGYEIEGQISKGLITYVKHFVLNDQESNRTGVSTFCDEQTFREIYLRGFEYGFTKGKSNAVMGGFNRVGTTWANAHKGLMTNLLTNEWGFNGVADTDFALWAHMEARSAVMAGTTDFAVTSDARSSELLKTLETDHDLYAAVRESCHRNLYAVANSAEMNGYTQTMRIVKILTPYQIALIIGIVVVSVLFAGSVGMLILQTYKNKEEI